MSESATIVPVLEPSSEAPTGARRDQGGVSGQGVAGEAGRSGRGSLACRRLAALDGCIARRAGHGTSSPRPQWGATTAR